MLLLLGLCLGLPLFSKSQEEARSWDDAAEQVSRRAVAVRGSVPSLCLSLPSVSLGRATSGLTRGMQGREALSASWSAPSLFPRLFHLLVTFASSEGSLALAPYQFASELSMELQSPAESSVFVGCRCLPDSYPSLQIS